MVLHLQVQQDVSIQDLSIIIAIRQEIAIAEQNQVLFAKTTKTLESTFEGFIMKKRNIDGYYVLFIIFY